MPDDDDFTDFSPVDRPELLPEQQGVADDKEARQRQLARRREWDEDQAFLQRILQDPAGRRFVWNILYSAGTFQERYATIGDFAPNPEATWSYRGQKDLGLRLYHAWSVQDRAGMLAVVEQFYPLMPKRPPLPKRRRRSDI